MNSDAETLFNIHDAHASLNGCIRSEFTPCCELVNARAWGWVTRFEISLGNDAAGYAQEAAHAAFKAIPGLKSETLEIVE